MYEKLEDIQKKREKLEHEKMRENEMRRIKSTQKLAEVQKMLVR